MCIVYIKGKLYESIIINNVRFDFEYKIYTIFFNSVYLIFFVSWLKEKKILKNIYLKIICEYITN